VAEVVIVEPVLVLPVDRGRPLEERFLYDVFVGELSGDDKILFVEVLSAGRDSEKYEENTLLVTEFHIGFGAFSIQS
jgi:hypothetical protein